MAGTPGPGPISPKLQRIAERARAMPQTALTSLAHAIDLDLLEEAYRPNPQGRRRGRRRPDGRGVRGAPGGEPPGAARAGEVGNVPSPACKAGAHPEGGRVEDPADRDPDLRGQGLAARRGDGARGRLRAGLSGCSYGFRPGRSAHQALQALWKGLMDVDGGFVLELDIERFFDALDHEKLREILRQRVRDGVLLRLIGKWLEAGVLEEGSVVHPETGTPQGGVISPLLANVFLDTVLDAWFEDVVRPRLEGRALLVRYADDAALVGSSEAACEVRALAPSGEVPASPLRAPFATRPTAGDLRLPRLHALLGPIASRQARRAAQDRVRSVHPIPARDRAMVPASSPSSSRGAAPAARAEATRTLRVLRDHRQPAGALSLPSRDAASVAAVAGPPLAAGPHVVGAVRTRLGALPAAAAAGRALGLPTRSEAMSRGAGCASRARPDLREPWASNRPGPPDRRRKQLWVCDLPVRTAVGRRT